MRKILLVLVLMGFIAMVVFFTQPSGAKALHARLGGTTLLLEVLDTDASRGKGLSGRRSLPDGQGILFVFPQDGYYGFWMKDMHFPIDILWLDSAYRIVDVWERADSSSYPKIFTPIVPQRYVLELPAGFFTNHALKKGDALEILK